MTELRKIFNVGILNLLLVVLFFAGIQFVYAELILKNGVLSQADLQMQEMNGAMELIFLGDSHAQIDVDPSFFDSAFNFASSGESYFHSYYKLKALLNMDNQIEVVVLPFDLHGFSSTRKKCCTQYWYWSRYIKYDELFVLNPELGEVEYKLLSLFPLIGNGANFVSYLIAGKTEVIQGHILDYSYLDFADLSEVERVEQAKLRGDQHFFGAEGDTDEVIKQYFYKILELALSSDKEVVLIKYPLSKDYFDYVLSEYIVDVEKAEGQILEDVNMEKIIILDYRDLYFEKAEFFSDPNHLNEEGIEDFMEILKSDLT